MNHDVVVGRAGETAQAPELHWGRSAGAQKHCARLIFTVPSLFPLTYSSGFIQIPPNEGGSFFKLDFPVQSFLVYRAAHYNPSKQTNDVHVYCLTNPAPILTIKPSEN